MLNDSLFITETERVHCVLPPESFRETDFISSLKEYEKSIVHEHKIDARSRKQSFRGKAISCTYSEREGECVALVIQQAKNKRHIISPSVA